MKKEFKYRLRRLIFIYVPAVLGIALIEIYALIKAGIYVL